MNKKFLSAILFGALMITSTGTFVSCKDYDDDINDLQEQIDKKASLDEMTSKLAAMESDLAACKSNCAANLAAAKAELEKAIDAAAKAAAEAKVTAAEAKAEAIAAAEAEVKEMKEALDAALAKNAEDFKALQDEFAALEEKVVDIVGKRLSGLVLNPELYWGGIEAVAVKSITYNALTLKDVTADADHSKDAPEVANALTEVTPLLTATYHMNPSSADLSDLTVENFSFLTEDKKSISRAASLKPEVTKFTTENGDLTVLAKFTEGAFKDGSNDTITVLALEVALDEESVVTSDYAAVYSEKISGFVLDNAKTDSTKCDPLPTTAAEAIDGDTIVKVAWNETVDLAEYVETHYLVGAEDKQCQLWKDVEKSNFSYKYELVGYFDGTNKTSQSAHAALNGSKLRPQLPADGKAMAWGETEQSQATIGRMPLVRVTLVDNNSEKNVAVGYVLVEITATPGKNTISAEATYTFADAYTLSCSDATINNIVAWYQIEETILTQLGISKAEFEANYDLELKEGDNERANLFDAATLEAKLANFTDNRIAVRETKDEVNGTTTDVLKMSINAAYAYEYFLANKEMSAIVRYAKSTGTDALGNETFDYVYVTLKWAPQPLNVNPVGEIANTDKIKQYWFADDNNEGGSGYNEIHVNVNVPGEDAIDTNNFDKNILETFVDGDITITGVDTVYADFQKLTTKFEFDTIQSTTPIVGVSGTTYAIMPDSTDAKILNAYKVVDGVVVLTSGEKIAVLKDNGMIAYRYNPASIDILNAAGRDALDKNVTATVVVKETNECGKSLIELKNNKFDVKFLRPITVEQATMDSFKDGVDVGTAGSKVALKLNFTDWRGYSFNDSTAVYDYYEHYGIQTIAIDETKDIETTVNGAWAAKPDAMKVVYTPAATIGQDGDYGLLTYINNNAEVGNFEIKVPFVVTYVWGEIKFEVIIKVEKTVG